MIDIKIPIKNFTDSEEILRPGYYVLYFSSFYEPDEKKYNNLDWSFDIPFSDFSLKALSAVYDAKTKQWAFTIKIYSDVPPEVQEAGLGVPVGAVIAALAVLAAVALVFVKGEKIVYIPSVAIIAASLAYIIHNAKGLLKG